MFPDLDLLEKPFLNSSRSKLQNHTNKLKWEDSLKKSNENANLNEITAKKVPSELDYNCNSNEEICQKQTTSDFYDPKDFLLLEKVSLYYIMLKVNLHKKKSDIFTE